MFVKVFIFCLFVFSYQDNNINNQLKINNFQNTNLIFTFISHQTFFQTKNKKKNVLKYIRK
jgi:hypothetical protein